MSHNKQHIEHLMDPSIYITKFVTDETEYAIGYLLSNGTVGVYYNDDAKFLLDSNGYDIYYFERVAENDGDEQDENKLSDHTIWQMNMSYFPKSLESKVTNLLYLRDLLLERKGATLCSRRFLGLQQRLGCAPAAKVIYEDDLVYVTDVYKKEEDTIFVLNNGTIQYEGNGSNGMEFIVDDSVIRVTCVKEEGVIGRYLLKNIDGIPEDLGQLFELVDTIYRDIVSGKIEGLVQSGQCQAEEVQMMQEEHTPIKCGGK